MKARSLSAILVLYIGLFFSAESINAQQPQPSPTKNDNDVVRVNTNLVQTDVMVFDKNGKFVNDLKREQFELKVDGKVRDISFFEYVKAGKVDEESKLAAARGQARTTATTNAQQPQTILLDRGRVIYLFVDDLHLSAESTIRTKKLLHRFIDTEIGQNDQAAIVTTTGQLGFLQQLTDNKDVLHKAINNIKFLRAEIKDYEYPPMDEHQAILIDRNDSDVLDVFVDQTLRQNPGMQRPQAVNIVQARARNLLQQNAYAVTTTLQSLSNIIKELSQLPGRKLIFLISDGFQTQNTFGDATNMITQTTSKAAKANTVIYSLDARGLITGVSNASDETFADPTGRLARGMGNSEITSTQDGLYALANDTGGRAIFNTNEATPLVKKALQETSEYYLLAWASDDELIKGEKFRKVEVHIVGRSDLTVKTRKGFLSNEKPAKAKTETEKASDNKSKQTVKDPITKELLTAIKSPVPIENLPTSIAAFYYNTPQYGLVVSAAVEIESDALYFENVSNVPTAKADVIGVIIDEKGKTIASIQDKWTITSNKPLGEQNERGVINSFQAKVPPGLYQVRVAIRDSKTGRVGNASTWIEVPDLKLKKLIVGSLIVAERKTNGIQKTNEVKTNPLADVSYANVSRRFSRSSYMRFITYLYNAALPSTPNASPDIALQIQIFRDDQPVTTTELVKVSTQGLTDFSIIPYAAEIPLNTMPAGRYVFQLIVIDRIAKTSATQKVNFTIE
jgi:VWFA-related protein